MKNRIAKILTSLQRGEKGMTGLETAIILIAFVTVASVLAYSVLTAGIFSAEKGKATIYRGLEQASATVQIKGDVIGCTGNLTKLETVQFNISLSVPNETVDTSAIVVNYWDSNTHAEGLALNIALASGSTERGAANILQNDEQFTVVATLPTAANLTAYQTFSLQLLPPTGAAVTITRTLPGSIQSTMDLH